MYHLWICSKVQLPLFVQLIFVLHGLWRNPGTYQKHKNADKGNHSSANIFRASPIVVKYIYSRLCDFSLVGFLFLVITVFHDIYLYDLTYLWSIAFSVWRSCTNRKRQKKWIWFLYVLSQLVWTNLKIVIIDTKQHKMWYWMAWNAISYAIVEP